MKSELIDAMVVKALEDGVVTFTAICSRLGFLGGYNDSRKVDRSLQRLRKRGRVVFKQGIGWQLLP